MFNLNIGLPGRTGALLIRWPCQGWLVGLFHCLSSHGVFNMRRQIALGEIFLQVQFSTLALLLSSQTGNSGGTITIELQSLANIFQSVYCRCKIVV